MADKLSPLSYANIANDKLKDNNTFEDKEDDIYKNFLYFFKDNNFYTE